MLIYLLFSAVVAMSFPQTGANVTDAPSSYFVGSKRVVIPKPTADLVEIGEQSRLMMQALASAGKGVVAAFVPADFLATMTKGAVPTALTNYATVEVSQGREDAEFSANDFRQATAGAEKKFAQALGEAGTTRWEETSRKLEQLTGEKSTAVLSTPMMLGTIFSKQDAYGFSTLTPVKRGTTNAVVVNAVLMRVKNRMLFVYFCGQFKDVETTKALNKATEAWVDAILNANKE